MFSSVLSFLAFILPASTLAANHGHLLNRRHSEVAKRVENITLSGRASNAKWSYYNVETGNASVFASPCFMPLSQHTISRLTEVHVVPFTTMVISYVFILCLALRLY